MPAKGFSCRIHCLKKKNIIDFLKPLMSIVVDLDLVDFCEVFYIRT